MMHLVHVLNASKLEIPNTPLIWTAIYPDKNAAEAPELYCPVCHWSQRNWAYYSYLESFALASDREHIWVHTSHAGLTGTSQSGT